MSSPFMKDQNQIHLSIQKGAFKANVKFDFKVGECLALWGPSGSGKTTLLRCIAGFDKPEAAFVNIAGEVWQSSAQGLNLPTFKRSMGYVFQEASIFSHLNVQDNLTYAVRRNKVQVVPSFWKTIVELLDVAPMMHKYASQLSGGERQRVAIARALLTSPKLLLLDEPLSALDGHKKDEVLPWLERVKQELGISMIYVTHALDELTKLADSVVVMSEGKSIKQGGVIEVLSGLHPHLYTDSHEPSVLVEGVIKQLDTHWHLAQLEFDGGTLWLKDQNFKLAQTVRVKISATDVSIATELPHHSSIQNTIAGNITEILQLQHPGECLVKVSCAGTVLLSKITSRSVEQLHLSAGRPVWLQLKSVALLK